VPREDEFQRLNLFELPRSFRGRSLVVVQFWWFVQSAFFKRLPQCCYPIRRMLLRAFGASIGAGVRIRPGVEVTYPWRLTVGDYAWIGDNVTLYSLGSICIGANSVISQNAYICAADHDYSDVTFPIRARAVTVGEQVWIGSDVWIGPGVAVNSGSVVGARSTVIKDLPPGMVCVGSPCKPIKPRVMARASKFTRRSVTDPQEIGPAGM
jgi:putative colanic acid biosynthesis acetyltransferase WcaF